MKSWVDVGSPQGKVGEKYVFTIALLDEKQNAIYGFLPEVLIVRKQIDPMRSIGTAIEEEKYEIMKLPDGFFSITFVPTCVSVFIMRVLVSGKTLKEWEFSALESITGGSGGSDHVCSSGSGGVTLESKPAINIQTQVTRLCQYDTASFTVTIHEKSESQVEVYVTDAEDNDYTNVFCLTCVRIKKSCTATYKPDRPGKFIICATLDGVTVSREITVDPAPMDMELSWVDPQEEEGIVGEQKRLTVALLDKCEGAVFFVTPVIKIENGEDFKAVIHENENGTFSISFTPTRVGLFPISVWAEGFQIAQWTLNVR
eukprot:TRINITY_DN4271_c1_g1_i1.p1 TRINITY_DN4271_c1_g1~~TRINITY_DN4271_c1_g1_i1.p1  ORF type:complete len:314 (-),score=76.36 TRINITY_DN4271_c1_g1_i1:12-953(-)